MLVLSYAVALAAMLGATLYLVLRMRPFITTTTMLIGMLLLIYGPATLSYTLSSGEPAFLIHRLTGVAGQPHEIFGLIKAKVSDFDGIIIAMNFSLALMYAGIIAGIELVNRIAPARAAATETAISNWNKQTLQDDIGSHRVLLVAISAVVLFMLYVSISEHHIATISKFFSIKDNAARDLFRVNFADSPNYLYRLVLSAVAPVFVIWGLWSGISSRSWPLLLAASLLFAITLIGKIELLSKAPPVFFLVQVMLAALLTSTNRISWKLVLLGGLSVFIVVYAITRLIIIFPAGMSPLAFVYSRVFEVESQTLLEYFATFPQIHPHTWGANIAPIAALKGVPFVPSYSVVAYTWFGSHDITNPSVFIADAWAAFTYAGVIAFSVAAGAICRSIDLAFLAAGKSVVGIAFLAATFAGVLALMTVALNTALFSGGLLLAPILAGLLVAANQYLGKRHPAPSTEKAAQNP
jgi:hypothetical protein